MATFTTSMTVTEDSNCRIIKLGGYTSKAWFFWGEKRQVPVTFAFEVVHRNEVHASGSRMSVSVYERLAAQQAHIPVYALSVGRRHWWWFRGRFYSTTETFPDTQTLREVILGAREQPPHTASSARPAPPPRREPAHSPYAIIGVERNATLDEIKQAYRQRIAEYHPDKVASLGVELRRVADEMTKKINHAYSELKALHKA